MFLILNQEHKPCLAHDMATSTPTPPSPPPPFLMYYCNHLILSTCWRRRKKMSLHGKPEKQSKASHRYENEFFEGLLSTRIEWIICRRLNCGLEWRGNRNPSEKCQSGCYHTDLGICNKKWNPWYIYLCGRKYAWCCPSFPLRHWKDSCFCQNKGCVLIGNLSLESKSDWTSQRLTVGSAVSSISPHIGRLVHICKLIKISVHWDNHFRQGIIWAPASDYNVTFFPGKWSPQYMTAELGEKKSNPALSVGIVNLVLKMSTDKVRLRPWTAVPKFSHWPELQEQNI